MISNRISDLYVCVNLREPSLILKILPSLVFNQPTNFNHWSPVITTLIHICLLATTFDLLCFIPLLFYLTYHQQIPSVKTLAISTSPSFFLSSLITTIGLLLTFSSSFLNLRIHLHFSTITLFPTSSEYPAVFIQVSRIILPFTILACCQTYPPLAAVAITGISLESDHLSPYYHPYTHLHRLPSQLNLSKSVFYSICFTGEKQSFRYQLSRKEAGRNKHNKRWVSVQQISHAVWSPEKKEEEQEFKLTDVKSQQHSQQISSKLTPKY